MSLAKKTDPDEKENKAIIPSQDRADNKEKDRHLGSSDAFKETEDPASPDPDNITDEKLDEWLDD
ncbi:MAG: hypothetical protein ABIY90_12160 [Puia sp.]